MINQGITSQAQALIDQGHDPLSLVHVLYYQSCAESPVLQGGDVERRTP